MSDLDQPRRIGRYEVVRVIGEGGMGTVFLARDPTLDRMVAIKTVRLGGLPEKARLTFEERFKNEARAVAKLRHPAVVAVHDTGIDDEMGAYSVFEYVEGESLRDRMDCTPGPWPQAEALRIVRAVGEALDAAHEAGIVHRDVKPANILLANDGCVKLADFGVARLPDAQVTREGTFLGTPSYAAPEALARGEFGRASDVWSLGVVAYELACGRHPFPGEDVEAVSNNVLRSDPAAMPAGVERRVARAILATLAKDPGERLARAGDLHRAMSGDAAVSSAAVSSTRKLIGAVAIILALVGAGLAVRNSMQGAVGEDAGQDDAVPATVEVVSPRSGAIPAFHPAPPPAAGAADAAAPAPDDAAPASPRDEEEEVKALMDRARRLLAAGDRAGARAALERVLAIDHAHPEARRLLSE
ncbi:MAG: serine/threonine protein kinase [Deltaproteobacteria bacterium]|nr:serine/threonine protein kinase [Deltaproteobacteria bacterium]